MKSTNFKTTGWLLTLMLFLTIGFLPLFSSAQYIIDNDKIRFGNGSEASINATGNVQQPFYYNSTSGWRKLTYSSYPLDYTFAVGGVKTNEWNLNGSFAENPTMSSQVIDATGFTLTSGYKGYGTIKVTGNITVGSTSLRVMNTYELLSDKSYIKVTTKVTNLSATTAENVRFWIGTRDDYVGGTDVPTKYKGNLVDGAFDQIDNAADRSAALKIITGEEGVLFYTTSTKGNTIINGCCSWTNVVNQDPSTSVITITNDGSYGFYVRMNDLAYNQSDEFTWYYAAGEIADLEEIIGEVAAASGAVSDITYTTATFNATTTVTSTGYYIVVPRDATAPTEAQIKAGVTYGGVTIINNGTGAMTADVERSFPLTGLSPGTNYDLYFVTEDATPAFSEIAKVQFSTTAYTVPTVNSTTSASSITGTSAASGGDVTADGGQTVTARGICWGTSSNPTLSNSYSTDGSGLGTFTSSMSSLSPGTTYYVRAYATNSVGTGYGPQIWFSTLAQTLATVTTSSISSITQNSAAGGGNVSSDGGATVTARGVCWNSTGNPTVASSHTNNGTGTGSFISSITGLNASTTYFVKAYATNSVGTAYGAELSFTSNHILTYLAGTHGTISGTAVQSVANLGNGAAVTAVGDANYHFVNWSDGSTQNPRTELNVTASKTVTANFTPNRLAFQTQPVNTIAGENIPVTVKITDSNGNTITSATNPITISIEDNPNAGVLNGTLTVNAVNGVAVFSNLSINETGEDYTLAVTCLPLIPAESNTFTIIPAALSHFTLNSIPDPQIAGTLSSPVVTAYDIYNNVKTNYTGTVTFSTDDPIAVIPSNYTFTGADQGSRTFGNGVILKTNGTFFVKVADGLIEGTQSNIDVSPAGLDYFVAVTQRNQMETAAQSFTITLTAYDMFDNLKTDYDGSYALQWTTTATPSGSGISPILAANTNYTFTAGTATIGGFRLYNAHETPTITATATAVGKSGSTPPITVAPIAINNFLVTTGTTQTAGIAFDVTVTARDQYNNVVPDYDGDISFKSSNDALVSFPAGPQTMVGYNGVRTFDDAILINTVGTYWFRAADAMNPIVLGTQTNIIVSSGAFDGLLSIFTVDTLLRTAGEYVTATAIPKDGSGNLLGTGHNVAVLLDGVATDYNGPIIVTDNGDGSYSALVRTTDVNAANIISSTVGGLPFDATYDITVLQNPAYNKHLEIVTQPSANAVAGEAFSQQPVLYLKDGYNNLLTDENALQVTIAANGSEDFTGTLTVTVNAGVATFSGLAYETAETITATFSATGVANVISDEIAIIPAATAYYFLNDPVGFVAGSGRSHYTVSRFDAFGNIVLTGDETVYLYTESTGTDARFYAVPTGGSSIYSVEIINGTSTAEFYYGDLKSGSWVITASDATPAADGITGVVDGHDVLVVDPAALIRFVVTGVDNPHYYGDAQSVSVEAIDIYGNTKTNYTGTITFQITDAGAVSPADYTFLPSDSGTVLFSNSIQFSKPGIFWVTVMDLLEPIYYGYQANIVVLNRPITITANDISKNYGDELVFNGTEFSLSEVLPYGQQIVSLVVTSIGATSTADAGTYEINLGNISGALGFLLSNYSIQFEPGTLTVNPVALTILPDSNMHKVYGDVDPELHFTSSGYKLLDDSTLLSGIISRVAGEDVGLYDYAVGTLEAGINYTIVVDTIHFEITPAELSVKAENLSREYGDPNPVLTFLYFGFTNGDDALDMTSEPIAICDADTLSPIGTYPIYFTGGVNNNYNLSFLPGDLTVTKAPLTATAEDKSKLYGESNPALTIAYAGFKNGETPAAITEPLISTVAEEASIIGDYPIELIDGAADNYELYLIDGILTVDKAMLTVSANALTKVYGDDNPTLTYQYSGFVNGENASNLIVEPTIFCGADEFSPVGDYDIVLNGGDADNYAITLVNDTLTITKAMLQATADDQQKTYGDCNPVFTIHYSGFKNGDDSSIITEPDASTIACETTNVGTYPITLSNGSAQNYDFVLNDGILTIIKANQTIAFDPIPTQDLVDETYTLTATASSSEQVLYESSNTTIASIFGNIATFHSVGTVDITASQPGSINYNAANDVTQSMLIVNPISVVENTTDLIKLYPNPCRGEFLLISPDYDAKISIYNMAGQIVLARDIEQGTLNAINIGRVAGVYQVMLEYNGTIQTRQLIVE